MDMEKLIVHTRTISAQAIVEWCKEDKLRLELLSAAMAHEDLQWNIRDETTFQRLFVGVGRKSGKLVCSIIDEMRTVLLNELAEFESSSFKEWYYSIWPKVETTDSSNMSKSLAIALECHNALYADGTLADATVQTQNKRIIKWFKDNHSEIIGSQLNRIRLVVKPD